MNVIRLFRCRALLPLAAMIALTTTVLGQQPSAQLDVPGQIELDLPTDVTSPDAVGGAVSDMGLRPDTAQAVGNISNTLTTAEWLGPLAPVALSPFFALTLLSGAALYGTEMLGADHALLQAAGPLKNPALFWTFLGLTIFTSIPKFSKVSKPFAQAADKVEAFAGIIVILALRFAIGGGEADPQVAANAVVYQAGVFSFTAETLLTIAMVINILMINSIKFFFELLIWVTPVPFLDAMFEVANKSACAGLMALYAFSPTLATIVNLILFGLCAMMFLWARRREVYYRTLMFDVARSWLKLPAGSTNSITVFPQEAIGKIAAKSRCQLTKTDQGWQLIAKQWFRPAIKQAISAGDLKITKGWFTTRFDFADGTRMIGSQRYHSQLDQVAAKLDGQLQDAEATGNWGSLKAELA